MKRYIKASSARDSFYKWYNKLNPKKMDLVDKIADENDVPDYDEADDEALEFLKDQSELVFKDMLRKAKFDDLGMKEPKMPKVLKDRPYIFQLRGGNPTWGDDILRIAESHGAIKVYFRTINTKTGSLFQPIYCYAVSDKQTAYDILNEVKKHGIVTIDNEVYPHEINWEDAYMISIDDYKKGTVVVKYHNYYPNKIN